MTQNQNKATPLSHSSATSRVGGFDICSPIIIGQPKPYCMSNWNKNHYLEGHRNVYEVFKFPIHVFESVSLYFGNFPDSFPEKLLTEKLIEFLKEYPTDDMNYQMNFLEITSL